jgi:phosphatidylglycerophosphatase A
MAPRPPLRVLRHPVHLISLGFGSGLSPVAPGTAGTLAAWLLYPLLRAPFPDASLTSEALFLLLLLVFFALGAWATHFTGKTLGVPDHGAIVWDEMVATWLVLFFAPATSDGLTTFAWQAIAVGLFRLFDILKPPPIRQADSRFKNGFGVMFDDLLAAAYTLLALAVLVRLCSLLPGA